jgi:hypothetical protein
MDRTRPGPEIVGMSTLGRRAEQLFDFLAICAVFLVVGVGAWAALLYVRHERAAGSASNQLRRIDEEARKAGWTKGSNGAWSIPADGKTNTADPRNQSGATNN